MIPHGVPELPLVDPDTLKPELGLEGREVILSFGLLGPGKGYEQAIEAMPAVVPRPPDARYVILGATHPDLLRREGEAYRDRLTARDRRAGHDRARPASSTGSSGGASSARWLEAADVFVTPYPNLDQIVSGTLSYAMSAGKAIVSTPYAYATELLAAGRGVLVEPGSPTGLATGLHRAPGRPGATDDHRRTRVRLQPADDLAGGRRRLPARVRPRRGASRWPWPPSARPGSTPRVVAVLVDA